MACQCAMQQVSADSIAQYDHMGSIICDIWSAQGSLSIRMQRRYMQMSGGR